MEELLGEEGLSPRSSTFGHYRARAVARGPPTDHRGQGSSPISAPTGQCAWTGGVWCLLLGLRESAVISTSGGCNKCQMKESERFLMFDPWDYKEI